MSDLLLIKEYLFGSGCCLSVFCIISYCGRFPPLISRQVGFFANIPTSFSLKKKQRGGVFLSNFKFNELLLLKEYLLVVFPLNILYYPRLTFL